MVPENSSGARNQCQYAALVGCSRGIRHARSRPTAQPGARRKMKTGKTVNLGTPAPNADKPEATDAMGRPATHRKSEVRLGREIQARIGQQLRAMYDEVVKEGVPQHISELVRRLSDNDDEAA